MENHKQTKKTSAQFVIFPVKDSQDSSTLAQAKKAAPNHLSLFNS